MTEYKVELEDEAIKALMRMDRSVRRLLMSYVSKRLKGCENPRAFGKGLSGDRSGEWRYRVGNYRILARIDDERLIIYLFEIGHRKNAYRA
jgi:mRNA interferase RelE/StbE